MSHLQFFGLLHLAAKETSAVNVAPRDFADQVRIYVNNAALLSASLKQQGIAFTLLTNDAALLRQLAGQLPDALRVEEMVCETPVPKGITFYSAHFKLDAFRHISRLKVEYAALCDLDVVCLRPMPRALHNIVAQGTPLVYDISDQVIPAYGHQVILDDLEAIAEQASEGRWMGGEFISGTPAFFRTLVSEIEGLLPRYFQRIGSMHHVGDEAYTSAAVELLRRKGMYIGDAGLLGIVGRYWNAKVLHPQKPWAYFADCFLLHLPADKPLLAQLGASGFVFSTAEAFIGRYRLGARIGRAKAFLLNTLRLRILVRLLRR